MKRLVCVVEGKGEVEAIPNLCSRILQHVGASGWIVDPDPIRQPRGVLVDMSAKLGSRPCRAENLGRAVALARTRPAHGVLVLCDADDDCPAVWGPDADRVITAIVSGAGVMAVREFETWLLLDRPDADIRKVGLTRDRIERARDAKRELKKLVPGYLPTVHQLAETRRIDVARLRERSPSFDKLVRTVAAIVATSC